MTMRSWTIVVAAVVGAGILGGCALGTRKIADIQRNPGRYHDRSVSVEGTVTSSFGGPVIPVQFYKVSDGTGEITVLSNTTRVPGRGSRVVVRGRVEEIASFGDRSVGLHLRQEHLSIREY
jgi:hypothetical protein